MSTSSEGTEALLETHQPSGKGERSVVRSNEPFTARNIVRAAAAGNQHSCKAQLHSGEGREGDRLANLLKPTDHIPKSPRGSRSTRHIPHTLEERGGDDNGSLKSHFCSAGRSPVQEGCSNVSLGRACWLISSSSCVFGAPKPPMASTSLPLDTRLPHRTCMCFSG